MGAASSRHREAVGSEERDETARKECFDWASNIDRAEDALCGDDLAKVELCKREDARKEAEEAGVLIARVKELMLLTEVYSQQLRKVYEMVEAAQ
jgi:hypothetical protein